MQPLVMNERPPVLWLTGLSGAGKSTLANQLKARFNAFGQMAVVLDGDELRHGVCRDLGFSALDRAENIRRAGEVARLFRDTGVWVVVALISPFAQNRAAVREMIGEGFVEVFVDTPLAVCERRDPKGLYARCRQGDLALLTGISSPYESPRTPDVHLDGAVGQGVDQHVDQVLDFLRARGDWRH